MSRYAKGANAERELVNKLAKRKGTIMVARCAGSKCKGKLKVDVVHLSNSRLDLYQLKKSKSSFKREKLAFEQVRVPSNVYVNTHFVVIK